MLRITNSASAAGAKEYFDKSLRYADYYAEGQEIVGTWHGEAAVRLGLNGPVTREAFRALIDNLHPITGDKLTPRVKTNRRPGTDFTFNAPKSVSLLHAVTGDERIVAGFRRAVAAAMQEVERDVATRVRTFGRNEDRTTGNLAWAEFLHLTARPVSGVPDPHLHVHAYVPNLTFDPVEQRWKALQLGNVKADGPYYEAVFLSHLASEMRNLGYRVDRQGRFWDVDGVPRALIEQFSRRTAEIEKAAAELGVTNPDTKSGMGARTRERKAEELTAAQLRAHWLERISPEHRATLDALIAEANGGGSTDASTPRAREAVEYAIGHVFERKSVASEREVLTAALHRSYGDVEPPDLARAIADEPLIRGYVAGRKMVTTRAVLDEEASILAFARKGRLSAPALSLGTSLPELAGLTRDQTAAVTHVLTSNDRLMVIRGGAGTGKTTLMTKAVEGMHAGGHAVHVFAPTSAARDVLRKEGFAAAETLQRLLLDSEMQKSVAGSVLWVDEAGLISVPDMARLCELADAGNCRIVLSGDTRQHASVERGDALRLIETQTGIRAAEVREIVRQRGEYKEAVASVSAGDVADGFRRFEAMGAIIEEAGEERLTALAADYARETRAGRSVLVVSPTHREKDAVTQAIRSTLVSVGRLAADAHTITVLRDVHWTEAERSDPMRYQGGEVIKFVQNVEGHARGERIQLTTRDDAASLPLATPERFKVYHASTLSLRAGDLVRITENGQSLDGHRLTNGATYRVRAIDADGTITFDENGWRVGRNFGHLDYGYCSTSVSSQGRTVDTVLVAMGQESERAMSREQFYVTVSRGRGAMRLYTDDREAIQEAIGMSGARSLASELINHETAKEAPQLSRAERLAQHTQTIVRMMQERARDEVRQVAAASVEGQAPQAGVHNQVHDGKIASDAAVTRR